MTNRDPVHGGPGALGGSRTGAVPPAEPDGARPDLGDRHRRVLGYLRFHLERRGHLPTTAELAQACRLRSTSSAHGVVRDLERLGLLVREAPQSRLARVVDPHPTEAVDEGDLWLLVRCMELQSRCELQWARDGMALTSDLVLLDWILQRAQQHLARLQAFGQVRNLLDPPDVTTIERMERLEVVMTQAARYYDPLKDDLTTWFTYSALGNAATMRINRNIADDPGLSALHLAIDTTDDASQRSDWRFCARALRRGDPLVGTAAGEIVDISDEATDGMRALMSPRLSGVIPAQAVFVSDLAGA